VCDRIRRYDSPLTAASDGDTGLEVGVFWRFTPRSAADLAAVAPAIVAAILLHRRHPVSNGNDRPSLRMRAFHIGTGSRHVYDLLLQWTNGRRDDLVTRTETYLE